MATYKVLMTYNFTIDDQKSLDFIVNAFAKRADVLVTLFSVYTPLPEVDVKASPELAKMSRGVAFLASEVREKEQGLKAAKEYLVKNGFADECVDYILKKKTKPKSREIIDLILKKKYHVLVLSRQAAKVTRFYARGVHNQLLSALKDITLCIAI